MIAVNQVGYGKKEHKHATITGSRQYSLYRADGTLLREDAVTELRYDENSGDEIAVIDFSWLEEKGEYFFRDGNGVESARFSIAENMPSLYSGLLKDALRMFYFQRCGMELSAQYAGRFARPACHCDNKVSYTTAARRLFHKFRHDAPFRMPGGWHDAGDFGRYVTAGAVAVGHMLYGWLLSPEAYTASSDIPESGNGIPDILNECRYELDWLMQMQETDGGVFHKATSVHFADFIMPQEDTLDIVLTPYSSMAAADLAAVCALAARIYRSYDAAYAEQLSRCAEASGAWLLNHPGCLYRNDPSVTTGTYEDLCDVDERLWAAVELYQLSPEKRWLDVIHQIAELKINAVALGWADVGGLASLSVLLARPSTFEDKLCATLRGRWLDEADRLCGIAEANAYELALRPYDFIWGSNMIVLCDAMNLCVAHHITGQNRYWQAAQYQLDYLLGRNALDTSYVTGYGAHAFRHPHNRVTVADGIDDPIPGFVSGGPNASACDDIANEQTMKQLAPMKCYSDHWQSYSTNEITIYWNSPLVFVLGYLIRHGA